jgi:hypothetical protein
LRVAAGAARGEASPGITWTAGGPCPDETGFVARVERHLGRPLRQGDLPPSVDVAVVPDEQGWLARVSPGGEAAREIQGSTCDDVTEAAALFVALLVTPEARADAGASGTAARMGAAPGRPGPAWHGWLQVHTGADWGDLPSITPSLGVGAAVEVGRVRLAVSGTAWWGGRAETDGRGATFTLWTISGGACWDARLVWLCGGVEGGSLHADAFGFDAAQEGSSPWGAATAGVERGVSLTRRIRLELRGEVVVPFVPARFTFGGVETVHEIPVAAGRVRLALEARFL